MNKCLFAFIFMCVPSLLFCGLKGIRKEIHFLIYDELTTVRKFDTPDYWFSAGKVQALSDVIYLIDIELMESD